MSYEMEQKYLINNRVNEKALLKDAVALPKTVTTLKDFAEPFGTKQDFQFNIAGYDFTVNVQKAFNHLKQNTYNENRMWMSGAFYDTLTEPLAVIKQIEGTLFISHLKNKAMSLES